mgnify:CR=1 FL=1
MSHSLPIVTSFKSQTALRKAFESLGWTFQQNTKIRTYVGDPIQNKTFDLVAINPVQHGYDIGVEVNAKGEIELVCDFFSPGKIAQTLGNSFTELKKKYVMEVTKEHYEEMTILEQFADGSLIIEADDGL